MREDDYWARGREPDDDPDTAVPVADLSDCEKAKPRGRRRRSLAAAVLAVAVATAGAVVVARLTNDDHAARDRVEPGPHRVVKTTGDADARVAIAAALSTTTGSGSFHLKYRLSAHPGPVTATTTIAGPCTTFDVGGGISIAANPPENKATPGCGYPVTAAVGNVTINGEGVVNVDPTAMATTAQVPNLGAITTRVDGTNVWEDGGANYGMTPSQTNGSGSPLSQFASLVAGTLGRREGAIAMNSLASPTGYLDFAKAVITSASASGTSKVDGVPVKQFEVTIDTMRGLERPGLTDEEIKATTAALAVLRSEGYSTTTVMLSIDGLGFIRRAQTVVSFDDGGTVEADTTFSDFGCSKVVMLPNGPSIVPNPTGCAKAATTSIP